MKSSLNSNDGEIYDEEACEVNETISTRKKRSGFRKFSKFAIIETAYKSKSGSATAWSNNDTKKLGAAVSAETKSSKAKKDSQPSFFDKAVKIKESLSFKLENWMKTMPDHMKTIPATLIAIPGTHNSHTHIMRTDMTSSQDSFTFGQLGSPLVDAFGGVKFVIEAWGRCVKLGHSVYEQLLLGLRYFDFR